MDTQPTAFANGWTIFITEAGMDIVLRDNDGETRGRASSLSGDTISGVFPIDSDEPIAITIRKDNTLVLSYEDRLWTLKQPAGKTHYFAFLDQWPEKSPQCSLKDMLKRLGSKS